MLLHFRHPLLGIVNIRQGTTGLVEVFGKYRRSLKPGINWVVPMVSRVTTVCNMQSTNSLNIPAITKDSVNCNISAVYNTQVSHDDSYLFAYSIADPLQYINGKISSLVRSETARLFLTEICKDANEIASSVKVQIKDDFKQYGIQLNNIAITGVGLDEKVQRAMNEVIKVEKERQAALIKAQTNKEVVILKAEAEKEEKRLQGEGLANYRNAIAERYLQNVRDLPKDSELSPRNLLDLTVKMAEIDAMKDLGASQNAKVIFYPSGLKLTDQYAMSNLSQVE